MTSAVITAIGGDVAQGVAACLRDAFPDWHLIGTDIQTRHGGTLAVDRFVVSPSARDPSYRTWLANLTDEAGASYCLPMSEPELLVLAAGELGRIGNARLVTAGAAAIQIADDKFETAAFLSRIGLPAPWTLLKPDQLTPSHFPCIYKPRRGAGSRSIFVCNDGAGAAFLAQRYPGGVFQELLQPEDAEITCAVFRDAAGRVAVLQLLRRLVGGATGWAQVVDDPEVTRTCVRIAEGLSLQGAINVQLRLTASGPRVFEINARFSSTALMRHKMGFTDVAWTFEDLDGRVPSLFQPPVGMTAVRVQSAAVIECPTLSHVNGGVA